MSAPAFVYLISILFASSFSPFSATTNSASRCFESIISFGDSLDDTGNQVLLYPSPPPEDAARSPFGRTFFHHPTGRYTDGRVVLDFLAQSFGLPLVPPYLGGEKCGRNFSEGVNFAVAGAAALDYEFYEKMGVYITQKNESLGIQWDWFKRFLSTISDSRKFLEKSLIVMGEIGANDYFSLVHLGRSLEDAHSLAPSVINFIGSKIQDIIDLGALTILVPGIPLRGCIPSLVAKYSNNRTTDKDYEKLGCVDWLNELSRYHNELLQQELNRIQTLNPHVSIIYADYYNNMKRIYVSPDEFGFKQVFRACCGAGGGPYNFDVTTPCGVPPATCCDDPSSYVSWEGNHFTEAVYKVMAQGFLDGPYTIPQMKTICPHFQSFTTLSY
ncbi:hypothetical protein ACS0TY_014528 [Phlomoides rotata]